MGRKPWEDLYGTQDSLLEQVNEELGNGLNQSYS